VTLAFVDANVLAQATPRTILYLASALDSCAFGLVFSPLVEKEAERAQRPKARPVSVLREKWLWQVSPDHPNPEELSLLDTHWKDQPVLAAAVNANARYVITENVRHFGPTDLDRFGMSAVHPGLFLAGRLTEAAYTSILGALATARRQSPNTMLTIHIQEVSDSLPDLFTMHQNLFGPAESARTKRPIKETFRGVACLRCALVITDRSSLTNGVCTSCEP